MNEVDKIRIDKIKKNLIDEPLLSMMTRHTVYLLEMKEDLNFFIKQEKRVDYVKMLYKMESRISNIVGKAIRRDANIKQLREVSNYLCNAKQELKELLFDYHIIDEHEFLNRCRKIQVDLDSLVEAILSAT